MSLYSYPLFNPECKSPFGGSEVRVSLITRELAKRGNFDVNLIVFDHGQPHIEVIDGVKIYSNLNFKSPFQLIKEEDTQNTLSQETESQSIELTSEIPQSAVVDQLCSESGAEEKKSLKDRLLTIKTKLKNLLLLAKSHSPEWFRETFRAPYRIIKFILKKIYSLFIFLAKKAYHATSKTVHLSRKFLIRAKNFVQKKITTIREKIQYHRSLFGKIDGWYEVFLKNIQIYDEVDADVYIMPGNNQIVAELVYYCSRREKPYIFLAGSDADYSPDHKNLIRESDMYGSPRKLNVYAIEHASAHITQNEAQKKLLSEIYGRSSFVVKNPFNITDSIERPICPDEILWVGKSDHRIKQPELFLNIMRSFPEMKIIMIMNLTIPETHERCLQLAKELGNIEVIEYVEFSAIERYFARAKLFVNTSVFEGFPNTFLQAAKYGVPIISLQVDPGTMLEKYGCGINCKGDTQLLTSSITHLMNDQAQYDIISGNCLRYMQDNHDKDKIIPEYEHIIYEVLRRKKVL